ncbi:hypothetical protein [Methylobrevis pamukkalensis]|uniref:Uncharacterized protein n=1 Tax=Methylobrevis pamukkalensis TaxID=1439726 RepID=A0A1E3H1I0_9HYPH|nr:hypothetical protein [Methylobrevis pamukkalensis]ODN70188.1 hypothetical protein A6302_02462 [Methylobrevis pamukkalensis]
MGGLGYVGVMITCLGWLMLFVGGGDVYNLHLGAIAQCAIVTGLLIMVYDGVVRGADRIAAALGRRAAAIVPIEQPSTGPDGEVVPARVVSHSVDADEFGVIVRRGDVKGRNYRQYEDGSVVVDTKYGPEKFGSLRAARLAF